MSNKKLDEFLSVNHAFTIETETFTRLSKHRKLLLGAVSAVDIEHNLPTKTVYSWSQQQLRACYLFGGVLASGIGVLDEWRELPSDGEFNAYGFDYVPGKSFRFRGSLVTSDDSRKIEPVTFMPFSPNEQQRIEQLSLDKAFINLALAKTLIADTMTTDV
jgi:hypothetical protein